MSIGSTVNPNQGMEAGEPEMRKHFEEVTTRNVETVLADNNVMREYLYQVQEEMRRMNNNYLMLQQEVQQMRMIMVNALQIKFSGGTEN